MALDLHTIFHHIGIEHLAVLLLGTLDLMQLLTDRRVAELEDAGVVRAADLLLGAQGVLSKELIMLEGPLHVLGALGRELRIALGLLVLLLLCISLSLLRTS